MRNLTCLLDHHQRSHFVTIGPEGKFHCSTVDQQPEGKVVRQSQKEVLPN